MDTLIKVQENEKAQELASRDIAYIESNLSYLVGKADKLTAFDRLEVDTTLDSLNRYKKIAATLGDEQLIAQVNRMEERYFRE